jgi:hypothetical protein
MKENQEAQPGGKWGIFNISEHKLFVFVHLSAGIYVPNAYR